MKYLYGASVQGIQGFIFETNELREIVGASELVEQICTTFFQSQVNDYKPSSRIMEAAGNIKYLFEDGATAREACENLVRSFPKKVMQKAPGITISQAIVEVTGDLTQEHIQQLETQLKIQRNQPVAVHGQGLMITERSRKTGKAGIDWDKYGLVIDKGQLLKRKVSDDGEDNLLLKLLGTSEMASDKDSSLLELGNNTNHKNKDFFPYDVRDIVGGKERSWLAVVHADGNNLGKLLLKMGGTIIEGKTKEAFRAFSEILEKATVRAASNAYRDEVELKVKEEGISKLPIRPIVLGGDDLTIIIRGDLALDFTKTFLQHFETYTKSYFKEYADTYLKASADLKNIFAQGLTACAGIAYIKPNYPFHYGVHLAESLCAYSKKIAKDINADSTPSCLTFHKVHSSFIENYGSIIQQELTATPTYKVDIALAETALEERAKTEQSVQRKKVRFNYGPYFLNTENVPIEYATVTELKNWVNVINQDAAPKGPLRNWLSQLTIDASRADQLLDRIKSLNKEDCKKLWIYKDAFTKRTEKKKDQPDEIVEYTHLFDVLALAGIESRQ